MALLVSSLVLDQEEIFLTFDEGDGVVTPLHVLGTGRAGLEVIQAVQSSVVALLALDTVPGLIRVTGFAVGYTCIALDAGSILQQVIIITCPTLDGPCIDGTT